MSRVSPRHRHLRTYIHVRSTRFMGATRSLHLWQVLGKYNDVLSPASSMGVLLPHACPTHAARARYGGRRASTHLCAELAGVQ